MSKTKFITYTAVFIAITVVIQYITSPLGQYVTGSLVNLILITACLTCNWKAGLITGILSPFTAKLFGIGPAFIQLVPVIAIANSVLVAVYGAAFSKKIKLNDYLKYTIAIPVSSAAKYLVLYLGIVKLVVPILNITPQIANKLSLMFGVNQLVTAAIGGVVAFAAVPLVKKATKK